MKILDTQFDAWKLISLTVEHDGKEYRMVDEYLLKCAKEANEMWSNVNADLSERHSEDLEIIKKLEDENKKLQYYKEQWQDIAGAANLKYLVKSCEELKEENKKLIEFARGYASDCKTCSDCMKDGCACYRAMKVLYN